MVAERPEIRERQIVLARAILDRAIQERGPNGFRDQRITELLQEHLHLASSGDALALLAEIRRRGG